ncbi:MAG: GFA family protein [Gammaproteobacteria bacterium]|nr:GFA family protein [Gammaproteobacteria bacterium]
MTAPFTGGCACGKVRYKCTAEPQFAAHCHCRDCQKSSGAQMATLAAVPKGAFTIDGETKSYTTTGDSGKSIHRHFCPDCGARLFTLAMVMPDLYFVTAGSMDDASWLEPGMHIYLDSSQPWARVPSDAVTYGKAPG